MGLQELADRLREMYATAPEGEKVVHIHLFGIIYAEEISRFSPNAIAKLVGLDSYGTEVSKGRALAKYVELKNRSSVR